MSGAVLSDCGLFRYRLDRDVQQDGLVTALFGINPSTADATTNDATIRKDIGFAKINSWRRIIKGNAFAFRSTDVRGLAFAVDPVGPENMSYLRQIIAEADLLIPCWGSRQKIAPSLHLQLGRVQALILGSGKPVKVFGLTRSGDPAHPLMLGYDRPLLNWAA